MSCAKDHKFWKEFVNRNDKKFGGGWSKTNQEKAEQGCLMFQKPIKIMLYGILPHSKMIKTVPVIPVDDGSGDYRGARRQNLLRHQNEDKKPAPNKPREKQTCKRCQMEEYRQNGGGGGARDATKCFRCKEAVSYHSFRCCTCGIEPMDPRLIMWDEGPRRNGRFDDGGYVIEEGDEDWDGYY